MTSRSRRVNRFFCRGFLRSDRPFVISSTGGRGIADSQQNGADVISFVVPAYNEELLLGGTLRGLQAAAQSLDESYEIVVVDDASTDGTAALAKAHGARVVQVDNRQIAATRNSGARAAQGDFLIFVDADTLVEAPVVRAAVQALRDGAVGGGCVLRFDGRLPFWARLLVLSFRPMYRLGRLASGSFLFCTRQAFEAVGGFNEQMYAAEEATMSRALRRHGRFVILRESVVTSGRKLRAYSPWEILRVLGRLIVLGPRKRTGLEIWYGARREDPDIKNRASF
jgi:glycosyltransferase involved in cell wall biosynthesis